MGLTIALTTVELGDCLRYFLTNEEKHAGVMWAAIMAYQYLSGARISEVLALKRRQICAENGTLHPYFKRTKLKTGKSRSEHTVRIDPACEVAQVVQRWMEESRRRYARLSVDEWAFACGFRDKPVRRDNAWKAYQRAYKFSSGLIMSAAEHTRFAKRQARFNTISTGRLPATVSGRCSRCRTFTAMRHRPTRKSI